MTQKILITIIATIILMTSNCYAGQWLWRHNEEIKGQVVEADSLKPIEGALIIALWELEDVVSEGSGGYERVVVVESSVDGHFIIPTWTSFKPWQALYKVSKVSPYILIFKPNYKVHYSIKPERDGFTGDMSLSVEEKRRIKDMSRLNPAKLIKITTDKERLESIDSLRDANFPGRHFSKKQLQQIIKAFEEEINNLSDTTDRKPQLKIKACEWRKFYIGGSCDK